MLFTTQPLGRNQASSRLFQSYGAPDSSPAPVTECRLFTCPSNSISLRQSQVWTLLITALIAAQLDNITEGAELFDDSFGRQSDDASNLFAIPLCVASISNPTETVVDRMAVHGFKRTSLGRYSFFEGQATKSSIMGASKLGAEMFSYAPQERVSLGGALALFSIRRLLHFTYQCNNYSTSVALPGHKLAKYSKVPAFPDYDFSTVAENDTGHFFPYFSGMVLPDRSIIHMFVSIYNRCFGKKLSTREATLGWLTKGWSSAANTITGRQVSHMVFVIHLAFTGGFRVFPQYASGEYIGTVIIGCSSIVQYGSSISAKPLLELSAEIRTMFSHESALRDIVEILDGLATRISGPLRPISVDAISTPRALHYVCADRIVTPAAQASIHNLVSKLRFHQTFYKPLDTDHLIPVLEAFTSKQRVDINVPFDILGGNLFTENIYLSTLSAYGKLAPSPLPNSTGANSSITVREGFQRGTSQGTLGGVPIFVRPVQEAAEAWKGLRKTGTLHFVVKGKDSSGAMKIASIGKVVHDSTPEGVQVNKLFIKFCRKADRKRERDDGPSFDGTGGNTESERIAKSDKSKKLKTEFEHAFSGLGWADADENMDD